MKSYPEEKPLTPIAKYIEVQAKDPSDKVELVDEVASYDGQTAVVANQLALLGLNDSQIAKTLGVSIKCFKIWVKEYRQLREVLNDGRDFADARVATALYQRATGYDYTEDRTYIDKESGKMEVIEVKKHIPADVGAAKTWLSARRPDQWKESKEVNVTVAPKKKLMDLFDDVEVVEGEFSEEDDSKEITLSD